MVIAKRTLLLIRLGESGGNSEVVVQNVAACVRVCVCVYTHEPCNSAAFTLSFVWSHFERYSYHQHTAVLRDLIAAADTPPALLS